MSIASHWQFVLFIWRFYGCCRQWNIWWLSSWRWNPGPTFQRLVLSPATWALRWVTWLYVVVHICGDRTCSHIVVHIACDCRDCVGFQNLVNELNIAYPVVFYSSVLSVPKWTCVSCCVGLLYIVCTQINLHIYCCVWLLCIVCTQMNWHILVCWSTMCCLYRNELHVCVAECIKMPYFI